MAAVISRVFMNGTSKAVRIPQEFRLNVNRVQFNRSEAGDLVIRGSPGSGLSFLLICPHPLSVLPPPNRIPRRHLSRHLAW